METTPEHSTTINRKSGMGCLQVGLITLLLVIVTAAVTYWVVRTYIFPAEFRPVTLSQREESVLQDKLDRLESFSTQRDRRRSRSGGDVEDTPPGTLRPEAYSEEGASRNISLSERELNALLAKNTDLARKLAIDLSDDLVSAKLLIPMDEDFPVLGGKILKVRAGVELAYQAERPVVILRGVSIMGVPIPNAWLGGLKNIDLVREFEADEGFWKAFAAGIKDIHVEEGRLRFELKE